MSKRPLSNRAFASCHRQHRREWPRVGCSCLSSKPITAFESPSRGKIRSAQSPDRANIALTCTQYADLAVALASLTTVHEQRRSRDKRRTFRDNPPTDRPTDGPIVVAVLDVVPPERLSTAARSLSFLPHRSKSGRNFGHASPTCLAREAK